jgi:membrane protein involved in colicin uptake
MSTPDVVAKEAIDQAAVDKAAADQAAANQAAADKVVADLTGDQSRIASKARRIGGMSETTVSHTKA